MTTTTLTGRYVADVARRLPEATRDDIVREIEATIADMIEAHEGPDAERDVLTTLGDPARLAHRYSDRPQYLIGPDVFPAYVRGLVWVLGVVGVIHVVANISTYVLTVDDPHIGEAIGQTIGKLVVVLLTAAAGVTIAAAVVEHYLPEKERDEVLRAAAPGGWTVDDLERDKPVATKVRFESGISIVAALLLAAIPFIPASFFYVPDMPSGATFVNPDLAPSKVVTWVVLALLIAAVELLRLERGRTTSGVLVGRIVVDLSFAVFLTTLLLDRNVLNPAIPGDFPQRLGDQPLLGIVLAVIWVVTVWDLVDTSLRHRRDRSVRS